MFRTRFAASALPLAVLAAWTAACAAGPPRAALPAPVAAAEPVPVAVPAEPAPEAERVEQAVAVPSIISVPSGRELLGSASYDLPVVANQWVASEVSFLVNQRHDAVGRWLERGGRYAAFVRETFAAAGIPRDLHHLAMVESGYQPTVRSRAGAVGMWQFMAETGRGMGLRIDDAVDERMDPVRSTRAAARHLRSLWRDFGGDWSLAAAAYNAGGGRISRGMRRASASGFWELAERGDLAQETRRYVPRLFAVTIIAKDPARFGYAPPAEPMRPFEFDSIQLDLATPLPVLAKAGGLLLGELVDLNPHLLRGEAPPFYWVWVPKGSGAALLQAYRASDFRRRGGLAGYTLRSGEDAASIARAGGVTVDEVRDLNPGVAVDRLGRSDRVRLYADAVRSLQARPVEREARDVDGGAGEAGPRLAGRPAAPPPVAGAPRPAEHVVQSGETLWSIAQRYELSVDALRAANEMRPDSIIQPGQRLRIPRPAGGDR
jgi:membrane-bound lytic murein transglycosylase D